MKNKSKRYASGLIVASLAGLMILSCFSFMPAVSAQTYSFTTSMQCDVYIQMDGSIKIEYWINMTNLHNNYIQWLDIGFPTENYVLDSVNASIDGTPISSSNIDPSSVIPIGVEIYLGSQFSPYDSAKFHVEAINRRMLFQDFENQSMASLEFSPTWFDSSFCPDYDYLEMNIWFPQTINISAEGITKWHHPEHGDPTVLWEDYDMYFQWIKTNVPMRQYTYGVSFPADAIDYVLPWTANPAVVQAVVNTLVTISVTALIVGILYFIIRYFAVTRKQYYPPKARKRMDPSLICPFFYCGIIMSVLLMSIIIDYADIIAIIGFYALIIAGFGMIAYLVYKLLGRARKPYMKPEILVQLAGVKKGLSVIEASVIRNVPINKVIFLIAFSLIRNGNLAITQTDPLKFDIITKDGYNDLQYYQQEFFNAVISTGPRTGEVNESLLKTLCVNLIQKTEARMKGFDLKATALYYDNMIKKAWATVEALPTEVEWADMEKEFDWIATDDLFEQRSEKVFRTRYYRSYPYWYNRYYYHSYYWHRGYYYGYYSGYRPPTNTTQPAALPPQINITSFSNSIVRGIENMSNSIVSNFSSFAEGIVNAVRPVVKVGGSSGGGSRSYRGGGGGCHCACACACAGCACACAGGGR